MNRTHVAAALLLFAAAALALPSYTGYSGAPGSSGTCAGTCHGSSGGTIAVVGFPAAYEAGQSYVVSVVHRGGSSINNFNASVRVGSGTQNAGTITAGYRTAVYSTGGESNGVHLSSEDQDSCTFNWQAPDPAVGDVKLYLAGHQGSQSGPNTETVLTASQLAGVSESRSRSMGLTLKVTPTVSPGPFVIRVASPAGARLSLRVVDQSGRLVSRIPVSEGKQPLTWLPLGPDGRRLRAGTYVVILQAGGVRLAAKLVLK